LTAMDELLNVTGLGNMNYTFHGRLQALHKSRLLFHFRVSGGTCMLGDQWYWQRHCSKDEQRHTPRMQRHTPHTHNYVKAELITGKSEKGDAFITFTLTSNRLVFISKGVLPSVSLASLFAVSGPSDVKCQSFQDRYPGSPWMRMDYGTIRLAAGHALVDEIYIPALCDFSQALKGEYTLSYKKSFVPCTDDEREHCDYEHSDLTATCMYCHACQTAYNHSFVDSWSEHPEQTLERERRS